jgi:CRISPR-associated endonuclease/helicase Cas3
MSGPLAHSGGHLLADHLRAVAGLAAEFSQAFDAIDASQRWAYRAGLWHDLGKYRSGFQRYLQQSDNPDAHIEGKVGGREKTHSAAGALWAIQQLNKANQPYGHILAYLIAGHHAGLDDWDGGLNQRLQSDDAKQELKEALAANPPADILEHGDLLAQIPGGPAGFALWVRMLFSCLVDADFLDTEAHFDAGKPARRDGFPTLDQMRLTLDAHMVTKAVSAPPSTTGKP